MLNEQQFIEEEKDCASMLGLTLKQYRDSLKNIKVNTKLQRRRTYDNSILYELGLTENDLKNKKAL